MSEDEEPRSGFEEMLDRAWGGKAPLGRIGLAFFVLLLAGLGLAAVAGMDVEENVGQIAAPIALVYWPGMLVLGRWRRRRRGQRSP